MKSLARIALLPRGGWYQGHGLVSSTWSPSQVSLAHLSTCVMGRTPEVLASWAVATSTTLLFLAFLMYAMFF